MISMSAENTSSVCFNSRHGNKNTLVLLSSSFVKDSVPSSVFNDSVVFFFVTMSLRVAVIRSLFVLIKRNRTSALTSVSPAI